MRGVVPPSKYFWLLPAKYERMSTENEYSISLGLRIHIYWSEQEKQIEEKLEKVAETNETYANDLTKDQL